MEQLELLKDDVLEMEFQSRIYRRYVNLAIKRGISSNRQPDETFKQYKFRQKYMNQNIQKYSKGTTVFNSRIPKEVEFKGKKKEVLVGQTYKKTEGALSVDHYKQQKKIAERKLKV